MPDKNKNSNKGSKAKKNAGNNQWTNTNNKPDSRERRDGPGGDTI
jgi:hypothetical protein